MVDYSSCDVFDGRFSAEQFFSDEGFCYLFSMSKSNGTNQCIHHLGTNLHLTTRFKAQVMVVRFPEHYTFKLVVFANNPKDIRPASSFAIGDPKLSKFFPSIAFSLVVGLSVTSLAQNKFKIFAPMALNFSLYGLIPLPNDLWVNTCNAKSSDMLYFSGKKPLICFKFSWVLPYLYPWLVMKTSSGSSLQSRNSFSLMQINISRWIDPQGVSHIDPPQRG